MQTHITFSSSEITGLLRRIRHRINHRVNMLKHGEYDFLMQMDYVLRKQKRTSLSAPRAKWLLDILVRTE
jgi:hypothetical protein